jgi:F-type H+-transporting ATPase subunit delta
MVELPTIARPYAEAVFQVAKHASAINDWAQHLAVWAQVARHPDVVVCLKNPRLNQDQVLELFALACKGNGSAWLEPHRNFLQALIEQDRLLVLPEIERQFLALKNSEEGCADALLQTAFPLSDAQLAELRLGLEKRFGVRLNLMVSVDSELIGGIRVSVGDQLLDNSVRARLEAMKQTLVA